MTLKTGIFTNVFWRSLQVISSLVLNILFARYLGAAGSGTFFYLITIYTLYVQVGGISLESALGFFTANNKIPVTSLASTALAWSIIVTVISILVFALLPGNSTFSLEDISNLALFISGNLLANYFSSIFFAEMNFRTPNLYGTLINILLSLSIALFLFMDVARYKPLITDLFFFSFFLRGVLMVISFYSKAANRKQPGFISKKQAWMLLQYSALAYAANMLFFILYRVDYYFVEKYCSAAELGNYIQVCRIAQMFFLIPSMIAAVIFPITSSNNDQYIRFQLPVIARMLFYSFLMLCGFLCITGKWLFPFVFGDDFKDMYSTFLWLVPGIIALSVLHPFAAYYSGRNQVSMNVKGSLLALVLIVTGDIIFIPVWGIRGAAAVSSIGYISYQLFVMIQFKKSYNILLKEFFSFQRSDLKRISRSFSLSINPNKKKLPRESPMVLESLAG